MFAPVVARFPLTLVLTLGVVGGAISPQVLEWAEFDRAAVAAGQIHRLVTGHFVHWNLDHLVWDLIAFVLLAAYCERRGRRRFALCLILATATIDATLWFVLPELQRYRGLSGLDSALFVLVAATYAAEARRGGDRREVAIALAALVGFAGKGLYEAATGATLFVDAGAADFIPLPSAHVAGGVAGLCVHGLAVVHRSARNRAWPAGDRREIMRPEVADFAGT